MRNTTSARAFAAVVLILAASTPARAQVAAPSDARWLAYLGCWEPADQRARVVGTATQVHAVCVVPTATASAVEIATVDNGKIVDRQRVDADGARHQGTRDGCTGWDSAEWSRVGKRVYVRSEYTCAGDLARSASGLLSITGAGEWLDVRGIGSGGNKGVRVLRYREVPSTGSAIPAELSDALRGRGMVTSASRVAAGASLTVGDIAEASHSLDAGVVQAWLIEFNAGAQMAEGKLTAKQLEALADAGVAPSVIDVVVALAYPHVFALNPGTGQGELRTVTGGAPAGGMTSNVTSLPIIGYDSYGYPIYSSSPYLRSCSRYGYAPSYSMDYACSPYCDSFYGMSSYGCSRYGYSSFGGYGYGYGGYGYYGNGFGWYPGSGGVIVVVSPQPTGVPQETHGRVVRGQGYTQGGSSGTTATPRSSSGSESSGSGSSGSASGGSAGASGGSSASAPRTAVPKKP